MTIAENISHLTDRVEEACRRSGRSSADVALLAVTKTIDAARIREAVGLGIRLIGENRVQEAWGKYLELAPLPLTWHLIGHLQTNKIRRALEFAAVIESVDSLHLAQEIDAAAAQRQKSVEIFLEVNTSAEATKFGVAPDQAAELAPRIASLPHLHLTGLMTIGALTDDRARIRRGFARLRALRDELQQQGLPIRHLSMGMSDDFEIAVEEGATLVRLGRALFGERV